MTIFPFRSSMLMARWVFSHARPSGKSGAGVVPKYDDRAMRVSLSDSSAISIVHQIQDIIHPYEVTLGP